MGRPQTRNQWSVAAPAIVEVPSRPFLMIDGAGDPNTSAEYLDAIETLFPLAYWLRSAVKAATGDAHVVMPIIRQPFDDA